MLLTKLVCLCDCYNSVSIPQHEVVVVEWWHRTLCVLPCAQCVLMFMCLVGQAGFVMNNSATEHDTTKLITSFHSESNAHSNDINISYYEKVPKIGENPLIIDLSFHQNLVILAMCSKH